MRPLILALTLLLCGCWEGPLFYSPSDAVTVLEPGRYEAADPNGQRRIVRITARADGMTGWLEDDDEDVFGFARINGDAGKFVVWLEEPPDAQGSERLALYGLLRRWGPNEFLLYLPSCREDDAQVAVSAGAERGPEGVAPTCHFSSRDQLENALRRLDRPPEQSVRLTRLRDAP